MCVCALTNIARKRFGTIVRKRKKACIAASL
jgi:hypothetical protein